MGARIAGMALAALSLSACDDRPAANAPLRANDLGLARFARQALPLTDGLERCRATHGGYPPNADAAIGCLPASAHAVRQGRFLAAGDWLISPDATGLGYSLMRRLDGTAMLVRRCSMRTCRWIFDPGDGRPSQEVKLAQR